MDLRDYPRPKNDTGIGVHWNGGFPAAVGLGQIKDFWVPELQALGVKWVKIARHDGGLQFSELLLKYDIMPVVRVYRFQPNPGTLDQEALRAIKDYVAAGVRYFEFNNEPDLNIEWQGNYLPPDALQIVARNAVIDMEAILAAGGYPGLPALAVGTKWDLVGEICRLGRRDLFAEPVWQALHNYSLNHPLDYPYDNGNQQGAAYTAEFYDRLAGETWDGRAWGSWSLEQVNRERQDHTNPGATAFDDPSCWRAYERYDKLIRDQIGRSLPILATENGYIVGERPDPRYPATTPQLHMAQTLEACRIMMGTSGRFDHAPDFYFCTAFWLLANYSLGHWAPEWEGQAWYSNRWPGGQLPVIAALKAEPKQARAWRGSAGVGGRVSGLVQSGAGLAVRLTRDDGWGLAGRVGTDDHYEFTDVPIGRYRVAIDQTDRSQEVILTRERPAATANFDLTGVPVTVAISIIRGVVRGGAGLTVRLTRPADGWMQDQSAAPDGTYAFSGLAAGVYTVALVDSGVSQTGISVDGRKEAVADLVAPGWGWQVADGGPGPGFGVVRCRVKGRPEAKVRLWTAGWDGMTQRTGSKPEYGPDVCEFAPLGPGRYNAQPEGLDVIAEINVDGARVVQVTFAQRGGPATIEGSILGTVANGSGRTLRLLRATAAEPAAQTQLPADGNYRFEKLTLAKYTLQVLEGGPGTVVVAQQEVVVDNATPVRVDLTLPGVVEARIRWTVEDGGASPGFSVVRCRVLGQAGRAVSLWTWGWGGITQVSGSKPEYGADACEFAPLGAGVYFVELEETDAAGVTQTVRAEVKLEPNRVAWVRFERAGASTPGAPPEPVKPAEPAPEPIPPIVLPTPAEPVTPTEPVTPATPANNSVIAGTVTYPAGSGLRSDGKLVVLAGPEGDAQATVNGGRYAFFRLVAGTYRVAVLADDPALGELAAQEEILLDGNNQVVADFELAAPAQVESQIGGRVRGGAGRTIVLEGPLEDAETELPETRTTLVAQDETYSFGGLAAGAYRATVRDTDPPTGNAPTHAGIIVDGANSVRIDFDLDALKPGKALDHYMLVGSIARSKDDFLAILRYVARFRPAVGSDDAEARQARHVTILGGVAAVSAMVEQGLRLSGCQVQRIEADFAVNLGKLLDENRPY